MRENNKRKKNWTLISRKKVYDGSPYINIFKDKIELPNGQIIDDYHRIEIDDAVMLIVENEREEIMVYSEYRHGIGEESYTFPAGAIENGEEPEDAAHRELLEETGYKSNYIMVMKNFVVSGSYMFSNLYYLHMQNINKVSDPSSKDMENPSMQWLSYKQVQDALENNKFRGLTYASGALIWLLKKK
tara:strand:- start:1332 stop:1892 length:561 start_codon:yes stop_codon:yes gene_type:complete